MMHKTMFDIFIIALFLGALSMLTLSSAAIVAIGDVLDGEEEGEEETKTASVNGVNPNTLPATSAGKGTFASNLADAGELSCKGFIYQASQNGIRYVRESGASAYFAAEVDKDFGVYKLAFGHLERVSLSEVDAVSIKRLRYALHHCSGPFVPSGTYVTQSQASDNRV